jgi:molecular chaperone GrpE
MSEKTKETKDIELNKEEIKKTKKENKKTKKETKEKDLKLKNKVECAQAIGELTEKHQRLLADMENLRRRTEEEKADSYKYRASGFIIEILPTIDMFESALKAKNVSEEVKN